MGYQDICGAGWRTSINETKTAPTIRTPINNANWGYPKRKRRKAIAAGLEYFARVRSVRSSQGR